MFLMTSSALFLLILLMRVAHFWDIFIPQFLHTAPLTSNSSRQGTNWNRGLIYTEN